MLPDSILLDIRNAGPMINSVYPDYVPVVSSDESMILFTSRRSNTTGGKINQDGQYFEDIYLSRQRKGWVPGESPNNWTKPINTKDHDACIGLIS